MLSPFQLALFLCLWELRLLTHWQTKCMVSVIKLTCRCHLRSNLRSTSLLWGGQSKIYQFPPCCLPTALVIVEALCHNLSSLQSKTHKNTQNNMDESTPPNLKHIRTTEKYLWHGTGNMETFCALFGVMWLFQIPIGKERKL